MVGEEDRWLANRASYVVEHRLVMSRSLARRCAATSPRGLTPGSTATDPAPGPGSGDGQPTTPDGARGRVLVVEDNEINQLIAHGVLRKLGFAVRIAGDGRQALAALDDADFDIVLMDCHMPEMAGFEATAQLRRREADQRPGARRAGQRRPTPVIAMTAGVLREDRDRCLAAGMDDFVAKPIKVEVLEPTMARYLTAGGAPPPSVPRQSTAQHEVPAAAAGAPQDGLDVTRLELLRQLDPDGTSGLLSVIVTAFLDDAPIRLDALRAAVAAGGGPPLTQAAHQLKGSAANLGATRVATLCEELEALDRSGTQPRPELLDRLQTELDAAGRALAAALPVPA